MTSDGRVPDYRPAVSHAEFGVGEAVRATTWLDHARLAHWVAGRGAVVVPQHSSAIVVDNATETFRYYAPGSGRGMYRMWCVEVRPDTPSAGAMGDLTVGATTVTFRLYPSDRDRPRVITLLEPVASPSYSEGELTIDVTNDTTAGGSVMRVESVACWELPRATLDRTVADCGVALDSLYPRRPIYSTATTPLQVGVPATIESIHEMTVTSPVRRIGHIGRWGYPLVINDAGGIPLTVDDYRLLPRKDLVGATAHIVRCRVWANDPGAVGEVRLVGGTAGAGSWASLVDGDWSDPAEVEIDCEDPSTGDGLPGGAYDTLQIQVRTDGVSAADVYGWCVYEFE